MQHSNFDKLKQVLQINSFRFSDNTTYGLGGAAKAAYFPKTEKEAAAVFDFLKSNNRKFVVLGNGSNVLASEKEFDGAVISTKLLSGIYNKGVFLYCLSGTTVGKLLSFCIKNGIGGLEYLAGIPASLGGLALMNGGIPSRHIGNDILNIRFYDGKFTEFSNENCKFGNKHSIMSDINGIITGVSLLFHKSCREEIIDKIKFFLKKRGKQPAGKNCGCVFKNPSGLSAGKLIDEAGLKGLKIGGAEVSDIHANFILNNSATPNEVYTLIQTVKQRVYENCGILLDEEVIYIGEFNDFDS